MSFQLGRHCRNETSAEERCRYKGCGPCVGPFPFASGFLAVLSTPLAADLLATAHVGSSGPASTLPSSNLPASSGPASSGPASSGGGGRLGGGVFGGYRPGAVAGGSTGGSSSSSTGGRQNDWVLRDDLARLRAATALPTRTGQPAFKVMEDIWLGSLLFRQPPSQPVTYVALSEKDDKTLVSDGWGLRVAKSSLLVHSKNHQAGKQLERFVAVHDFFAQTACVETLEVTCQSGCRAFLNPGEKESMEKSASFSEVWGAHVDNATFCNGKQSGAAYCRVGAAKPRKCARKPDDLLKRAQLWLAVAPKTQALVNATSHLQLLADRVAGK